MFTVERVPQEGLKGLIVISKEDPRSREAKREIP